MSSEDTLLTYIYIHKTDSASITNSKKIKNGVLFEKAKVSRNLLVHVKTRKLRDEKNIIQDFIRRTENLAKPHHYLDGNKS